MTGSLRVGVIGAGIGEQHVAAFALQPGAEVAAVCARTDAGAGRIADQYGVAGRYLSYERMLERERLDVVVVAPPNHLHHHATIAALEAGAHVVCEKPLALDAAQARDMAVRAQASGRRHFVPFTWRFLPAARHVKALLDAGAVGRPFHAHVRYFVCGWGEPAGSMRWQFDPAQAGSGALANVGSHAVDLARWWLGDVEEVVAGLDTAVAERTADDGSVVGVTVEDTASLVLRVAGGVPVTVILSSVAHGPRVSVEAAVFGSDGAVRLEEDWSAADAATGRVGVADGPQRPWRPVALPGAPELAAGNPFAGCFRAMAAEVVTAIREERPARPSFADGVAAQEVIDAALRSARERAWVRVEPAAVTEVAA